MRLFPCLFDNSHSKRCHREHLIVSSICISDDQWYLAYFYVFIGPSYAFSKKCLFSSLTIVNWVVFFLLSLMSLYTFDSYWNIWLANILSYSMPWLLVSNQKNHWKDQSRNLLAYVFFSWVLWLFISNLSWLFWYNRGSSFILLHVAVLQH